MRVGMVPLLAAAAALLAALAATATAVGSNGSRALPPKAISIQRVPLITKAAPSAISCSTTESCAIVGSLDNKHPLLAISDNGRWTTANEPTAAVFESVDCPEPGWCLAVGVTRGRARPFAQMISGGKAAARPTVPIPAPSAGIADLRSVSCTAIGRCVVTGSYGLASGSIQPFAATLAGGHWSASAVPTPPGTVDASFDAVSCPTSAFCAAVGRYWRSTDPYALPRMLVATFRGGTWTTEPAPMPAGHADDSAQPWSLSCARAGSCLAVAGYLRNDLPLREQLQGSSWRSSGAPPVLSWAGCAPDGRCLGIPIYHGPLSLASVGGAWSKPFSPGIPAGGYSCGGTCMSRIGCMRGLCAALGFVDPIRWFVDFYRL